MGKAHRSRFGLVGTAGRVGPLELSTCRSGSLGRCQRTLWLLSKRGLHPAVAPNALGISISPIPREPRVEVKTVLRRHGRRSQIPTRRASEGKACRPSLARRVGICPRADLPRRSNNSGLRRGSPIVPKRRVGRRQARAGCFGAGARRVVEELLDRDPGFARVAQRLGPGNELEGAVIEGHLARCVTFVAFLRRDGEDRGADGLRASGDSASPSRHSCRVPLA